MDLSNLARYPSLKDKVVFITGGGTGIGAAIVESFVDQGSRVAFVDIDVAGSSKLVDALQAQYGRKPLFIPCDLKDIGALREAVGQVTRELGDVDVLVNNAANDTRHKWQDVTPEYWDERQAINIRPMFFAIQAVAPRMVERRAGSIINLGSVSWKNANGGMPAYTTAKSAVNGLTRGMARDLGQHHIRVNTVVPGWVMTERQLNLWVDAKGEREMDERQCLAGRVKPIDIARMVLYLGSDDAKMCSAQEFVVDAGWA
ncbi:SDR family NAD(P)-dependent oxidoreductase [Dongia sp.]|uniref:SDR family NAD(P)-dependent oxidoreductase n=1 Tax=Dongia sp. TaxID=1977262 RepID=UPI0035B4030F